MSRTRHTLVDFLVLVIALYLEPTVARLGGLGNCAPSSCGNIHNISYPFRLEGDPIQCGDHRFELVCQNNKTIFRYHSINYYVQEIFYDYTNDYGRIQVVDASLDRNKCTIPRNTAFFESSSDNPFYTDLTYAVYFLNCEAPVNSSFLVDVSPCNRSASPETNYAMYGDYALTDIPKFCSVEVMARVKLPSSIPKNLSIEFIYKQLLEGFELVWHESGYDFCKEPFLDRLASWGLILLYEHRGRLYASFKAVGGFFAGRTLIGIVCLIALVVYKFRRRHLSMDDSIEDFLQNQNNMMPIRYPYSEIKRMTQGFKNKLGQGGYGSVYEGKLRSGLSVAIKMLGRSKANGQDFINEVATIGRIHHVNVVRLIGFCVEGSKQALVYEFMPNGSLDKILFSRTEKAASLSWAKLHEIALGVARGIEYLHRGCEMQILHFDIKPHNILLDEDFVPKVSDFGLAKLYPVDNSVVSLTAARGTLGYIAPELFYSNLGATSYKADVYSFGMLLLEMAGRRRNVNPLAEHSSQIYYPTWIYDQLDRGMELVLEDATEDEKKIVKKIIIVAFWCIQVKPMNRPSMNKVLEMLEGEVELLQVPPKPFIHCQEMSIRDCSINYSTEVSTEQRSSV